MRVFKTKEFLVWLGVNIFTPIFVPFLIIQWRKIEMLINLNWCEIFIKFGETGAFIFFGLYVLISLLPHFFSNTTPNVTLNRVVGWAYFIVILIVILITSSYFITYLKITNSLRPFNLLGSVIATIFGVICAIIFKVYFLLEKNIRNTPSPDSVQTKLTT